MSVREKVSGDVSIIMVRGNLLGGKETTEVHELVKQLIASGKTKVVFDLSRVKWMNSSGMGMLMACYSTMSNVNGKIGIAAMSEKVEDVMQITKINTLFENFDTVQQAVKFFNQPKNKSGYLNSIKRIFSFNK